jgi:tetratricopeptide (TPR) repeat protein
MTITRKARGTEIPHRAQRIFFCCDEQDSGGKDSLVADLLSMDAGMDCVVSYLETRDGIDTEALRNELREHQALALWVTARLIDSMTNGKIPEEYRLAKELNVPILPIAEYGELFPRFTQIAGAVHGIARPDAEYRVMLKARLETFLALEEIIGERDFNRGIRLLERAAEGSGTTALRAAEQLADIYEEGIGTAIDYAKALEWRKRAVVLGEQMEHPGTAVAYYCIARDYEKQGDYPQALEWYNKVLAIFEKTYGKEHPGTATIYHCIAIVYEKQDDDPRALEWHNKALAVYEKTYGKEHPRIATIYHYIAGVYGTQGDYPRALEWNQKVLVIREKTLGKEHLDTAETYNNMAIVYILQGDYPQALEWYNKALAVFEKVLGKEHPLTAETYNNIAAIYRNQGDYPLALEWYHKALAVREKALGKEHPDTAETYKDIALVYYTQDDYPQALEWFRKASAAYERLAEKDLEKYGDDLGVCCFVQADILHNMKCYDEAEAVYHTLIAYNERLARSSILEEKYESRLAQAVNNLGRLYRSMERYDEAEPLYRRALSIWEKLLAENLGEAEYERMLAIQLYRFGLLYAETGRDTEAEAAFTRALSYQEPLALADPDKYGIDIEDSRMALVKLKKDIG